MTAAFTMVFVLNPGDCDINEWRFTNQANPPSDIGDLVRLEAGVFKWTYDTTATSVSVTITGPDNQHISMPEGMGGLVVNHYDVNDESTHDTTGMIPRWYALAPYQPIFYDNVSTTLELTRLNNDHFYYGVFYPTWVPNRVPSGARALLTIPLGPSLDFGEIQSVTKSYRASNTVLPIMCYGYRSSFVMDLGTTETINLKYIRVQPVDFDDNSEDSRDWSNAKWQDYLRSLMNRWQMRTNGQQFYLLNPLSERLPKAPIEEIQGLNCYIASAPIKYTDMGSHAISGDIELYAGTLYPKKKTPPMKRIYFRLGGDYTSQWPNSSEYREMAYPDGSVFKLPEFLWAKALPVVDNTYYYYITHWSVKANDSGNYSPGSLVDSDEVTRVVNNQYTVYAMTHRMDISSMNTILYNGPSNIPQTSSISNYFVVELLEGMDEASVEMIAVGGGGGGSSGYQTLSAMEGGARRKHFGGGGGGSVGGVNLEKTGNNAFVINRTTRFDFTIGAGGSGGTSGQYSLYDGEGFPSTYTQSTQIYNFKKGNNGADTTISVGTLVLVRGSGGLGASTVSEWDEVHYEREQYPDSNTNNAITFTIRQGAPGGSNTGAGGKITAQGGPNWHHSSSQSPYSATTVPVVWTDGDNGTESSNNHGRGGAKANWAYRYYFTSGGVTRSYNITYYATGGGGGGGASVSTLSGPLGGNGAPAVISDVDNLSDRHGQWGGGGGGGSVIMTENVRRTTAGGNGGRGYIWVRVTGGIITEKGW